MTKKFTDPQISELAKELLQAMQATDKALNELKDTAAKTKIKDGDK